MPEPRYVSRKISAGVILVDRNGRVLMQLRDDTPGIMFPDHWGLTGGAGHTGETQEQTARREVLEETGITLGKIEPFKAYYFGETKPAAATPRRAAKPAVEYELYLYHAPCDVLAEELVCGEGRELRFFSPDETAGIDVAYNHREVLADFFASPAYALYLRGVPFGQADADSDAVEPLAHFLGALDAGVPWFEALMQAIALWEQPREDVAGREYRYLIGGEAFDWLLLAERLLTAADGRIPAGEGERLLFEGRAPAEPDAAPAADANARLSDERLRALIGDSKHRAHLNYLYGVTVEEALQYAVELEVAKERTNQNIKDPRSDEAARDPIYERIYGQPRADLLTAFRAEATQPNSANISLTELREFMYWLFKFRVKKQEPARVASDTRKALAQLSAMENAVRRGGRQRPQPAPAEEVAPA